MRFPSFPNIVRTLYTFSNATALRLQQPLRGNTVSNIQRATVFKSMPSIPFFGALFGTSTPASAKMTYPDTRSDDEWQAVLNKGRLSVHFRLQTQANTQPKNSSVYSARKAPKPLFTGEFDKHMPSDGVYTCAACEAPLYTANHKFKSGCGWPAYFDSIPGAVTRHTDSTFGMARTEIVCSNCGGHLGHVFKGEGYATPTDERHCVNSISLKFNDKADGTKEANGDAK